MKYAAVIILVILCVILQLGVFSNLSILGGTADILLVAIIAWAMHDSTDLLWLISILAGLFISTISALPLPVHLVVYLVMAFGTRLIQKRIWQMPILAMLFMILVGSVLLNVGSLISLSLFQTSISFLEAVNHVILPSTFLNLLIAIPVYLIVLDIGNLLYPEREEV